jgi:hypothetical protein
MLSAIVAETEVFFAEMCKWCLQKQPNKIRAIKKTLEISDLDEAQSLIELRNLFIEKEIDEILRKNPQEQIESMQRLLDVEIFTALKDPACFFEIFERRNVLLHAGGKASRQYLSALRRVKYPKDKLPTLNQKLEMPPEYFKASAQMLLNFCAVFGFRVWHKFSKGTREAQDNWYVGFTFNKIADAEYADALEFMEMCDRLNYEFTSKICENRLLINRAQCYKWQKLDADCERLLAKIDWSAHADQFVLCVKALRGDFGGAAAIVKAMGKTGPLSFDDYCAWPVFKMARDNSEFCHSVEQVFGKKIVPVRPVRLTAEATRRADTPPPTKKLRIRKPRTAAQH